LVVFRHVAHTQLTNRWSNKFFNMKRGHVDDIYEKHTVRSSMTMKRRIVNRHIDLIVYNYYDMIKKSIRKAAMRSKSFFWCDAFACVMHVCVICLVQSRGPTIPVTVQRLLLVPVINFATVYMWPSLTKSYSPKTHVCSIEHTTFLYEL